MTGRDAGCAFQVAVLGGGPAGSAAALGLARRSVRDVLVVEAGEHGALRVGESLPPDTRRLLQELGIWHAFEREGHERCLGSCASWGHDELGYNDFLFNPLGHGWHLDRRRFDAFLGRAAAEAGAEVRTRTRFVDAEPLGDGGFRLELTGPGGARETVRAQFVIDALGPASGFARRVGSRRRVLDQLLCVYGFFEDSGASSLAGLTLLEAVEYGWWYAARLPNGRLAAAVACDPEFVQQARLRDPERWLDRMRATRHLARHLTGARLVPRLLVRQAPSYLMSRLAGDHWLAVGDAASAFDPLAAQGIHKALADGISAAEQVAGRLDGDGRDFAAHEATVTRRFDEYLSNRNFFYGQERRWPAASFWTRRRQRCAL